MTVGDGSMQLDSCVKRKSVSPATIKVRLTRITWDLNVEIYCKRNSDMLYKNCFIRKGVKEDSGTRTLGQFWIGSMARMCFNRMFERHFCLTCFNMYDFL